MARQNPKKISPFTLLSSPITSQTMSEENFRQNAAAFIGTEPDHTFDEKFKRLIKNKRFRGLLSCYATDFDHFGDRVFIVQGLSEQRAWHLYRIVLREKAEELTEFVQIREATEQAILNGEYAIAETGLNACFEKYGESIWHARTKMLLLSETKKVEELQNFSEDCKKRAGKSFVHFVIHCCQLIIDSENAALHLKTLVSSAAEEFKEANFLSMASLLELLFVPAPLKSDYDYLRCLYRLQGFPFIDIYVLLTSIIQRTIIDEAQVGQTLSSGLDSFLAQLTPAIKDPLLERCYQVHLSKSTADIELSEAGKGILSNYVAGEYQRVVDEFRFDKTNVNNPLAYVNVVAKASAYCGPCAESPSPRSVIDSLVDQLALVYRLDPLWARAEEALISTLIRFHHFARSAHIQIALYKALPYRYAEKYPATAANLSIITDKEITPLTLDMSKGIALSLRPTSDYCLETAPSYRRLKMNISQALLEDNKNFNYAENLETLRISEPLFKDYIELVSYYYLTLDNEKELIDIAASILVNQPHLYVGFPLAHLIKIIEQERLANVSAVLVAYFYNIYISPDRDYVLNEAFEEFLQANEVEKPSELLERMQSLTPIEHTLFVNVCSTEVMDFLSCFSDTNELRAERVKLLDLLEDRNAIDSNFRMREVEEIVGQVIVDAESSNFNSAKIYVNDALIKKIHIEEFASLFSIYKNAKDATEDRITIPTNNDLSLEFLMRGYVSGSKNTAVMKMYSLISNAFLFNEKFGLDKNLSAEIRHGFFSNLMRARLEEKTLLTEIENGKYKDNTYWRHNNYLIGTSLWNEIEIHLKAFSKAFNELICEAEEWMKIVTEQAAQPQRMFDYVLDTNEFEKIRRVADLMPDADSYMSYLVNFMWHKTDQIIDKVRERLNVEFREKVDKLFEELETNIRFTKRNVACLDMMNAIAQARNEIKEDITTVAEWFKRTEVAQMYDRPLDRVVEIAISSFEEIKGGAFAIEKSISPELRSAIIPGIGVKPLIIAIINLLDNCYRHSGLSAATRVEIHATFANGRASVMIKNNLSNTRDELLSDTLLSSIKEKIENPEKRILVLSEGGSGLIKAHNEINSFGMKAGLKIHKSEQHFSSEITYEY